MIALAYLSYAIAIAVSLFVAGGFAWLYWTTRPNPEKYPYDTQLSVFDYADRSEEAIKTTHQSAE